jgi:hypothetical protein
MGDLEMLQWLDALEPEAYTDVILILGGRYDYSHVVRREIVSAAAPDPGTQQVSTISVEALDTRTPRFTTLSALALDSRTRPTSLVDTANDTSQRSIGESVVRDSELQIDDYVMNLQLLLFDERRLADNDVRSDLYFYADAHDDEHGLDYQTISGRTGPVFNLGEGWQIHTALEGSVSLYDYEPFSLLSAGGFTLQRRAGGLLRSVHLRVGGENFSSDFDEADAWFSDLSVTLGSQGILTAEDWFQLKPGFTRNQARRSRFRYSQGGVALRYGAPLVGGLTGAIDAWGWRRHYDGHAADMDGNRRDWHLVTGVTLSYTGLFGKQLSLELRYELEKNWSNDTLEDYDGHSTGVFFVWHL